MELALGLVALLIPAALAVLSFGPWLERRAFVRAAAAQAAEWMVQTDGDVSATSARLAAMAANQGMEGVAVSYCGAPAVGVDRAAVSFCGSPLPRGGLVSVRVSVEVPVVGPFRVGGFSTAWQHTLAVDRYRSR